MKLKIYKIQNTPKYIQLAEENYYVFLVRFYNHVVETDATCTFMNDYDSHGVSNNSHADVTFC